MIQADALENEERNLSLLHDACLVFDAFDQLMQLKWDDACACCGRLTIAKKKVVVTIDQAAVAVKTPGPPLSEWGVYRRWWHRHPQLKKVNARAG